jgi:hypothetical protein
MTITAQDLTNTSSPPVETEPAVRIVGWVDEVPRLRRSSPFDSVIAQLREMADTTRIAQLQWDDRQISANKVNQLRKRYPDVEFTQVTRGGQRETYARYRGQGAE